MANKTVPVVIKKNLYYHPFIHLLNSIVLFWNVNTHHKNNNNNIKLTYFLMIELEPPSVHFPQYTVREQDGVKQRDQYGTVGCVAAMSVPY